jgi:hypothetical protein
LNWGSITSAARQAAVVDDYLLAIEKRLRRARIAASLPLGAFIHKRQFLLQTQSTLE